MNFRFWPKNPSQFWLRPFFWRSLVFGLKKRLNFRFFREIPSQFLDKPSDSDSRTMKIRVKVVCSFLTLSKKPPLFFKSWLRTCKRQILWRGLGNHLLRDPPKWTPQTSILPLTQFKVPVFFYISGYSRDKFFDVVWGYHPSRGTPKNQFLIGSSYGTTFFDISTNLRDE